MSAITDFCIKECERQNDLTTEAVAGMVEAWYTASHSHFEPFTIGGILILGKLLKPQNKNFRNTPVVFQNGNSGVDYREIDRLLNNLFENRYDITYDEFYIEFEKIHPFEDGNGRLGAILWNLLQYNHEPVCPPDFFNEDN